MSPSYDYIPPNEERAKQKFIPVTIRITREEATELRNLIDWGIRGHLFRLIVQDLIKELHKNRDGVLMKVLQRTLTLNDFTNIVPAPTDESEASENGPCESDA